MPRVGVRQSVDTESRSNRFLPLLESLKDVQSAILTESGISAGSLDVYRNDIANETLKDWFISESYDPASMSDPMEIDDHESMMAELYENDKTESIDAFNEATGISTMNPTIGFNMAMHKNLLMNSVFKQGIPSSVAVSPKFTETFQRFYLKTPDGQKYDIALEQDKLYAAMQSTVPTIDVEIKLPEYGATDIIDLLKGSKVDKLAIDTFISGIKVEVDPAYLSAHPEEKSPGKDGSPAKIVQEGGKWVKWIEVKIPFTPHAYSNDFDRTLTKKIDKEVAGIAKPIAAAGKSEATDIINANLLINGPEQKVYITSATGLIQSVKLNTKIDSSLGTIETCSTDWETEDTIFEIPAGYPLNTTITPDIVKDINALYNLNHISVVMDTTMKILDNFKDNKIMEYLDESFRTLDPRFKFTGKFDFKPRQDYAFAPANWRKDAFMDLFESYGTKMLNMLNDPDMSFSIFGRTDIIRRITPNEYTYQSPSSVGPVKLDFNKTVHSSNNRVYSFLSSRKIRHDDLIVTLRPNNGNKRKIYNLYEYSFYMGNEIRNQANPTVPALHAYERFLMADYQPVQGRVRIINPTGYEDEAYAGM